MITSEKVRENIPLEAITSASFVAHAEETPTHHPLLLPSQFIIHHPKAGLNPLVDSAASLFSIMGKLKLLKSYRKLGKLHQQLVQEINRFQEAAKTQGYTAEYIAVSRYAFCATLDDIITHCSWGADGQWDNYSLLETVNQEPQQPDRFFMIVDRMSKQPDLYIDVMELMYLCLSFGYKGSYRANEFSHYQLEQIINALYKRIRAYRGDFSKMLSPFSIKAAPIATPAKKASIGIVALVTLSIILSVFAGLGILLNTISNQTYQELTHIGKSILYETPNP